MEEYEMKKKILGFLVCMLFIISAFSSFVNGMNQFSEEKNDSPDIYQIKNMFSNDINIFSAYNNLNNPPNQPTKPVGPAVGDVDENYRYESYFSDPDGDSMEILFDWGDGTNTGWVGVVASGSTLGNYHSWATDGIYQVKTKARDLPNYVESIWSEPLAVTIGEPTYDHKMHFPQMPDEDGWAVSATYVDEFGSGIALADDWMCSESGPVADIRFWGAWKQGIEGTIDSFWIRIHEDIPADQSPTGYSMPGELLWWREIFSWETTPLVGAWQGWFCVESETWDVNDHNNYYQYDIVDIQQPFIQQEGSIYWLSIETNVLYEDSYQPVWGWKSSEDHWNDDAVSRFSSDYNWDELYEPPNFIQSLDLSFVIYGDLVEDNLPPTTTKTIGEPKYGEDDYWINASTQISFTAIDNPGGSGVNKIYYRIGDDNGMGAWTIYTTPFQISGTSGNYRYYIEYYAVDNAGNEEDVHHQEHIVDNALPLTILDIYGLYFYDSDYIYINDESEVVFHYDDTCCRKIDWIKIDFEDFYIEMLDLKERRPYNKIEVTITNSNGNWDGTWVKKEGDAVEIDIPEEDETCTVSINIQGVWGTGDNSPYMDLPLWGRNPILVNCEWLEKQAEKARQCFKKEHKDANGKVTEIISGKFKVSFHCNPCDVKNSGVGVTQYNIFSVDTDNKDILKILYNEWITYTGPFTIPDEGFYYIQYRSIDNLGQMEPIKTTAIIVDNTAPITPELLLPADNAMTNATPFFDWEENEDDLSGILYTLQISSDQSFNNVELEAEINYDSQHHVDIEDRLLTGEYYWRLKVSDFVGNADEWSEIRSFTVKDSNAPNKPITPSGQKRGEIEMDYTYSSSTIDPDGDVIYYNFSWGDGTYSGWFGPFDSDQQASSVHNWTEKGDYEIKVKAMDEYGKASLWSDPLVITMPKTYNNNRIIQLFQKIFERFPFLNRILNPII
jgi:hypothetical protein